MTLPIIVYGYDPPQLGYGPLLQSKTEGVDQWFKDHHSVTQQLRELLQRARERMKNQADKHRSEREFVVGDLVYLKLKPYKQLSLHRSPVWKLTPKFCGPFPVTRRIGAVAYELQLPADAKVHPVFHVSLLKKHIGTGTPVVAAFPPMTASGQYLLVPVKILERRLVKRNNAAVGQVLVQWAHLPEAEATWEDAAEILHRFPQLQP
ncbi:hypothetical protein ABFS83_14G085600 [Erythranthe nasuta]